MSRFLNLVLMMVGLFGILVVQAGTMPILTEMRDEFNEDPASGDIDQDAINNDIYVTVVKWPATIAMAGLFIIGAWAEFDRQRTTTVRTGRPPPF